MIRWDDSDLGLLGCLVIDGMSKLHFLLVWDSCLERASVSGLFKEARCIGEVYEDKLDS